jgi:hypothetical protein
MRISPVRRRNRDRQAGVSPAMQARIDRALDEANLSQREIARRLGISASCVSRRVRQRLIQDVPGVPFAAVRYAKRCEECGLVSKIVPCVRCAAGQRSEEN